jgi:hypothetical protein
MIPEADWDEKTSATIHTKKFKRPPKLSFFEDLYGRL